MGIIGSGWWIMSGRDNRVETIAGPFVRVKPIYTFMNVCINTNLLTGQSLKDEQKKTRMVSPG